MPTSVYKIYKCTNTINGKIYIGYTKKSLQKRIIEHRCSAKNGSDYFLHKAIRKYGEENFLWEVILESKDQEFILNQMESHFIEKYNCFCESGYGYNMTHGGQGGMSGKQHSIETRIKMKKARNESQFQARNPLGIGLESAIIKSAEIRRGKPSWNAGKKCPQISANNGGRVYKGKTWYKDSVTGKRVWVV